jgi:hypothetical protein
MKGRADTRKAGTYGDIRRVLAARSRAWYRKQRDSGGCGRCSGKADPGMACCQPCRVANAAALRSMRARDKAAGICTRCHCDKAQRGKTTCRGCRKEKS